MFMKKNPGKRHKKIHADITDQKSLHEFYTFEQKHLEEKEKRRKEHEIIEMQIFEHLKEHTKKVLKKN
jgi:hypothetical protein